MSEKNLEGLLNVSLGNIKSMVDSNSIIGEPIVTPDGTTIIPVSKVSFGFASGGSDFPSKNNANVCFGGGSGAGVTITPIAFLVVSPDKGVSMLPISQPTFSTIDKVIDSIPNYVDRIKDMFPKKESKDSED